MKFCFRIQRTTEKTSADDVELTSVTTDWHHLLNGLKENQDKGVELSGTVKDNTHTEKDEVRDLSKTRFVRLVIRGGGSTEDRRKD